ncbi:MAG TPA: SWIM zinc finger family protein [Phaeodactylibacter sp.]|nr:SWIM zinc finger family protein [Phaeodactylibacter sp.]
MEWTYEKIRQWAPNALLLDKGRQLASPRKWGSLHTDGQWVWGDCQSSTSKTHHTIVKLDGQHSRCSCQERYSPCRHAIAMLWLMLRKPELVSSLDALPTAFQRLRDSTPPSAPTEQQAEERQQARDKRLQDRIHLMQGGVEELEQWLADVVRQGLSTLEEQPWSYWERTAARMTDAKLSGIAGRIRQLPELLGEENWHEKLLEQIAELHLFVQAFRQLDSLPAPLQEEVLTLGGRNQKKEDLLKYEGVKDHWLVIGLQTGEEEQLHYRRTWLLGEQSGRYALILDYAYGRQPFTHNWVLGSAWQAELVFYRGSYPLRALVKNAKPHRQALEQLAGYPDLQAFSQAYASALSDNPWIFTYPALLEAVSLAHNNQKSVLSDPCGYAIPVQAEDSVLWSLMALTAGQPTALFGEWNGASFTPLSAVQGGRVIALQWHNTLDEEVF